MLATYELAQRISKMQNKLLAKQAGIGPTLPSAKGGEGSQLQL
jgi:hypothetical protein